MMNFVDDKEMYCLFNVKPGKTSTLILSSFARELMTCLDGTSQRSAVICSETHDRKFLLHSHKARQDESVREQERETESPGVKIPQSLLSQEQEITEQSET